MHLRALYQPPISGPAAFLFAVATAIGLLAGINPQAAIAGAVGLVLAMVVVANLTAGLCLFAVLAFLDTLLPSAGSLTPAKGVGLLLGLSWLAATARDERRRALFGNYAFLYLLVCFVGWAALSAAWAEEPGAAVEAAFRYAPNAFLFVVVFAAVRNRRQIVWVVGAFVTGSLISALYGLFVPSVPDVAGRLSGAIGGANETAAVLVAGLTLAAGLTVALRGRPLLQVVTALATALCALGAVLTVSRGALVALGFALLTSVVVAGRRRGTVAAVALLLAACMAFYFFALAPPEAQGRFEEVQGGTGRTDIWTMGVRMALDRPVTGVGAGNFESSSVHYLLRPGLIERGDFIVDDPKVAHNVYLHVLAELGMVGLLLFLSVIVFSMTSLLKAARRFARLEDLTGEVLSRAVFVALAALLAADFFASEQYSKQLWLLLALGPAMLSIAEGAGAVGGTPARAIRSVRSSTGAPTPGAPTLAGPPPAPASSPPRSRG